MNDVSKWQGFYADAKKNMIEMNQNGSALIVVFPVYPLLEHKIPCPEYKARLDAAVKLYQSLRLDYDNVSVYFAQDPSNTDVVGLDYEVGWDYLRDAGIHGATVMAQTSECKTSDDIYSGIACYLLMKQYETVHVICGTAMYNQVLLSLCHYGLIPEIHTVYHPDTKNFVDELLLGANILLNPDIFE